MTETYRRAWHGQWRLFRGRYRGESLIVVSIAVFAVSPGESYTECERVKDVSSWSISSSRRSSDDYPFETCTHY